MARRQIWAKRSEWHWNSVRYASFLCGKEATESHFEAKCGRSSVTTPLLP